MKEPTQPLPSAWGTTYHCSGTLLSFSLDRAPLISHIAIGKMLWAKAKAQRQPRQRLPRGEEERHDSAQPQPFQGSRFQKHFPGRTHFIPTPKLWAAPPFIIVCRRGQLGLREVGRHSHDSQLEAALVPRSPQFGRRSAHLVKRRSSTCWGGGYQKPCGCPGM